MEIKITKIDLDFKQAEFFKFCCQYENEIIKLKECGFFEYPTGRILIDKANGKIREIDKPERHKWPK